MCYPKSNSPRIARFLYLSINTLNIKENGVKKGFYQGKFYITNEDKIMFTAQCCSGVRLWLCPTLQKKHGDSAEPPNPHKLTEPCIVVTYIYNYC